jgi:adenylate cyclase
MMIDPEYPLALSLAGWCHAQRSIYNWADDIAGSQTMARSLAERAAEMSGDDPTILAVLGAVHTFVRNYGTARVLLERAVTPNPNAAWAWSRLGWLENYADQPKTAVGNFDRALRLSPIDPMNFNNYVGIGSAHEVAPGIRRGCDILPTSAAGATKRPLDISQFGGISIGSRSDRRGETNLCGVDCEAIPI